MNCKFFIYNNSNNNNNTFVLNIQILIYFQGVNGVRRHYNEVWIINVLLYVITIKMGIKTH